MRCPLCRTINCDCDVKRPKLVTRYPVYAIYKNPSDYPGKFVVRCHRIIPGRVVTDRDPVHVGDTLTEARWNLPKRDTLRRLPREETDDPAILEMWV